VTSAAAPNNWVYIPRYAVPSIVFSEAWCKGFGPPTLGDSPAPERAGRNVCQQVGRERLVAARLVVVAALGVFQRAVDVGHAQYQPHCGDDDTASQSRAS
jgi:hypothetical protein